MVVFFTFQVVVADAAGLVHVLVEVRAFSQATILSRILRTDPPSSSTVLVSSFSISADFTSEFMQLHFSMICTSTRASQSETNFVFSSVRN